MSLREIFAANLRHWRQQAGFSQEELAHRAEIDRTYVSCLERSQYSVTLDVVEKIAQQLDIEPAELLIPLGERPSAVRADPPR